MSNDTKKLEALEALTAYISAHGGEIPRDPNALVYYSRTRTDCEEVTYQDAHSIIDLYRRNLKKYRQGKVFLDKYNKKHKHKHKHKEKERHRSKSRRTSFPPRIEVSKKQKFRKREESKPRPRSAKPGNRSHGSNRPRTQTSDTLTAPVSPYSPSMSFTGHGPRARSASPSSPKSYKTRDPKFAFNRKQSITPTDSEEKDEILVDHEQSVDENDDDNEPVSPLKLKLQHEVMKSIVKIDLYDQQSPSPKEPKDPEIVNVYTQNKDNNNENANGHKEEEKEKERRKHHDHHIGKDGKCIKCNCDHSKQNSKKKRGRDTERKGTMGSNSDTTAYEHGPLDMSTSPRQKRSGSLSIEQSVTTMSNMDYDLDDIEFMEQSIMSGTNTRIIHKSYTDHDHDYKHVPIRPRSNEIDIDDKKCGDGDDSTLSHGRDDEESKDVEDSFSSFIAEEEKLKKEKMKMDIYEQRALKDDEFVNSSSLRCCYVVNAQSQNEDGSTKEMGVWATILSFFAGSLGPADVASVVSKPGVDSDDDEE